MKSRWTIWLLLAVVAAVWGVVAWKIFRPAPQTVVPDTAPRTQAAPAEQAEDTLRCDYPDPFLKNNTRTTEPRPAVRDLPPPVKQVPRERVYFEHLGTIRLGGKSLYVVTVAGEQHELHLHEQAGEFVLAAADADSLYFQKQGLTYGVVRCE